MKRIDVKQLTFHAQSAWDRWYRFSDRACHYTAQTWEWYCQTVFSTEAMERYETIGDAIGLMMVCTVSLGMAARVTWEDWRRTDEAQQLAELAVETLEDAKPHVERLAYQAVNLIARPVLNHLEQGGAVLSSTQAKAIGMQGVEGGAVLDRSRAESMAENQAPQALKGGPVLDVTRAESQALQAFEGVPVIDSTVTDNDDLRVELRVDNTDWLTDEDAIDVDIAMISLTEHLEAKELPELLLIADQLDVAVPTVQCSKSELVSLIWGTAVR